jgi:septal ring factor EnvC (AmiA/AmiB activator)
MVKNQHLLAALVVLGAVNLLAFFGVISGERDSAREVKGLTRELTAFRDEQKQRAEEFNRETGELRRDLEEARSTITQLRGDVDQAHALLAKTRKALQAVEEGKLDKPAGGKD